MGPVGHRGGWFLVLFCLIVLVWSFLFLFVWNCLVCLVVRFTESPLSLLRVAIPY